MNEHGVTKDQIAENYVQIGNRMIVIRSLDMFALTIHTTEKELQIRSLYGISLALPSPTLHATRVSLLPPSPGMTCCTAWCLMCFLDRI